MRTTLFSKYYAAKVYSFGLISALLSLSARADTSPENVNSLSYIFIFIIILLLLFVGICCYQTWLIYTLRQNKKKAIDKNNTLKENHQTLEQRFYDRSTKLINLNSQLYEQINKQEDTEKLLRETQSYIQSMVNSMPSILIGVTPDGIITHWNRAAKEATSIHYDKALNKVLNDIAPELDISIELIKRAISTGKPQKRENRPQGFGSHAQYTDLAIYPLVSTTIEGAVIRIDDVTLRVRLETMMIQNEKMNSLGELAAGVAHEINNPLGIILQNIQNIKRRLSNDISKNTSTAHELDIDLKSLNEYLHRREVLKFLDDVKDAGERATVIVKNMLEFSRADSKQFNPINIVELLNRSVELSKSTIKANKSANRQQAIINTHFPEICPEVNCSASELQQVILNLLSNAHDSFYSSQDNSDAISPDQLQINIALRFDENHMTIDIADNGPGMNKWTQRHIFDPFFTTKEVGEGTGLGLSVSYFIITEHHQGKISVDSTENKGTTFTIEIPLDLQ